MLGTLSMWQIFYLGQITGCIFFNEFFICVFIFQFSWQIYMLKSYGDKKTYLTLVFLNQGWLLLLEIIKINTLHFILVLILLEKSENIADFSKS